MSSINNLMGLGTPPAVATEISEVTVGSGLAALGTAITGALALTSDINLVTSVHASTADGVKLRTPLYSQRMQVVINRSADGANGASALKVYPPTGGRINAGTVNAAVTIPAVSTGATAFYAVSELDYYKSDQ